MLAGSRRTRATSAGQSENMSKVQMLRCLVNQRLTAAAEEIFGVFERTIAEYEEELSRSKEQNERQRKLLDADSIPQLRLHRAVSTDVEQLLMRREVVPPEQQDWSSSLDQEDPEPPRIKEDQEDPEPPHIKEDQEDPEPPHIKEEQEDPEPPHIKEDQEDPEPPHIKEDQEDPEPPHIKEDQEDPEPPHIKEDPEPPHIKEDQEDPEPPHIKEDQEDPEPPHIKEEQEELWTSQEGEQLPGLEEADIMKFSFTPVKSEDDEEEAQSSQLHQRQTEQMETEADGEDCGGPEPDRNSDPDTDNETEDRDDWKQNRDQESGSNSLTNVLDDEEEAQSSQLREEEHLKTEPEDPLPGRPCDRLLSASSDEKRPLYRIFSMATKRKRRAHDPKIAAAVRHLHNSKANRRRYDTAQGMESPHNEAVTSHLVDALAARPDLHSVHHDVLLSACKSYFEFVHKRLVPLAAAQSQQRRTITDFALHARTLTMENTRRNAYDAAFKLKAIRLAVEEGNRAASRTLSINESMVRRWRRQHEELTRCKTTTKAFRGKKSRWPELENALEDWVNTQRADGRGVSTVQIRLKAKTIATEKNIEDFRAGPSWCFRFMQRKGLSTRTRTTACQQLPPDSKDGDTDP